jgi:DNA-binding NarL/FixJ family response regulator
VEKLRLLLVDDQRLFVDNLKIVLESRTKDMKVEGIAYGGTEALAAADTIRPDMILMDVRMPNMDGVEATRLILKRHPEIRIVMLTTFDDDQHVRMALLHGAVGYVLKSVSPSELISSIRAVRDGAVLVSSEAAGSVVHQDILSKGELAPEKSVEDIRRLLDGLTARELEIVDLISLAYDNRQIARKLCIAEQTVKNGVSIIFMKLGISRRTQLMRFVEDCRKYRLIK